MVMAIGMSGAMMIVMMVRYGDDDDDACNGCGNEDDDGDVEARRNVFAVSESDHEKPLALTSGPPRMSHGAHSPAGCAALTRVASKTTIAGGARYLPIGRRMKSIVWL